MIATEKKQETNRTMAARKREKFQKALVKTGAVLLLGIVGLRVAYQAAETNDARLAAAGAGQVPVIQRLADKPDFGSLGGGSYGGGSSYSGGGGSSYGNNYSYSAKAATPQQQAPAMNQQAPAVQQVPATDSKGARTSTTGNSSSAAVAAPSAEAAQSAAVQMAAQGADAKRMMDVYNSTPAVRTALEALEQFKASSSVARTSGGSSGSVRSYTSYRQNVGGAISAAAGSIGGLSASDILLIKQVVQAEDGICSYVSHKNITKVILNRVASSRWPGTVLGVVSQAGQFAVYPGCVGIGVSTSVSSAVDEAIHEFYNGSTHGYYYFYGTGWENVLY